jgi:hypothetical protein
MAAMTLAALGLGKGIMDLTSANSQAEAQKLQGDYAKSRFDTNARLAEMQGEDAIRRGDKEADQRIRQVSQVKGSQRVALAAQGIDIDSGSAAQVQGDTAKQGAEDVATIRGNAWREAWGYRAQAQDMRGQGEMAFRGSRVEASNTLLTGGLKAAGNIIDGASGLSFKSSSRGTSAAQNHTGLYSKPRRSGWQEN